MTCQPKWSEQDSAITIRFSSFEIILKHKSILNAHFGKIFILSCFTHPRRKVNISMHDQ